MDVLWHDDIAVDYEIVFLSCFLDGFFTECAGFWGVEVGFPLVTTESDEV
jgi:hypothetical protein